MKRIAIFFCFLEGISFQTMYTAEHQELSCIERAINNVWSFSGTVFERIQTSFSRMAQAFERFWFHYTGRPLGSDPHGAPYSPLSPNETMEDTLEEIRQSIEEINTISEQTLDNRIPVAVGEKLSSLEVETLHILQDATQKALQADGLAGGGGMVVLYWLYHEYNFVIMHTLPTRFPGAGIFALSTFKVLAPLLKPFGALLVGAYAWYKIKQAILHPYKTQYQAKLERFKTETDRALDLIKKEFYEELKSMHQENVTLQRQVKEEIKKIRSASASLQNNLHEQVTGITQELRTQTGTIAREVSDVKRTNQELKGHVASVLPMLSTTQNLIAKMKEDNARLLERIRHQEITTDPAKKKDKKERRFGLF